MSYSVQNKREHELSCYRKLREERTTDCCERYPQKAATPYIRCHTPLARDGFVTEKQAEGALLSKKPEMARTHNSRKLRLQSTRRTKQ